MPERGLPGGRGFASRDERLSQDEQYEARRDALAKPSGWVARADLAGWLLDHVAVTANILHLCRIPLYSFNTVLYEARIHVGVGLAGTCYAGIYIYDNSAGRRFILMGPSRVALDITTSGLVTQELNSEVELKAGMRYFIGTLATSAASLASVINRATGGNIDEGLLTLATTILPKNVEWKSLTVDRTVSSFPVVSYFSKEAAQVL